LQRNARDALCVGALTLEDKAINFNYFMGCSTPMQAYQISVLHECASAA